MNTGPVRARCSAAVESDARRRPAARSGEVHGHRIRGRDDAELTVEVEDHDGEQ